MRMGTVRRPDQTRETGMLVGNSLGNKVCLYNDLSQVWTDLYGTD